MQMRAQTQPFLPGMIIMWSGTLATVPGGWALCDGDNGTPNLSGLFVMAAGATHAPNTTGGSEGHTHTFTAGAHSHGLGIGNYDNIGASVLPNAMATTSGTTNNSAFKPSYHILAYIMKL